VIVAGSWHISSLFFGSVLTMNVEDELGTELIHRTSRFIALTEAGREFFESSSRILDDFENAASRIGRGQTAPKGLIRVTVEPVRPKAAHCRAIYPKQHIAWHDAAARIRGQAIQQKDPKATDAAS
jgi:DNA-binding transcriptional LysR family regulator